MDALKKYQETWAYKELYKKYSLTEKGIWQVLGEDTNCDLGGTHIQPTLGFFEGELGDVIEYAVTLPGFWQWGSGGDFMKVKVQKIPDTKIIMQLKKRKKQLEDELSLINLKLENNL